MKVLLLFLFAAFFLAIRSTRRGRAPRAWTLMFAALAVSVLFLDYRVI